MNTRLPIHAAQVRLLSRRWRQLTLALGCALVLSLFVSSFWQGGASLAALGTLQAEAGRIGRLDSMLIQLVEAESGARGYLLSRSPAYLEPYHNSLATIEYTLEEVRRDAGSDPRDHEALAQLTGLITLKLRVLSEAVGGGTVGEEAPRGAANSEGRRYMDTIRLALAELKGRMVAQSQRSLEASIAHVQRTRWVVALLSGGALALLAMLFTVLQRQFRLRERLAELLQNENARLDALVQARTAELSDLASHLTRSREAERARLARELHDELGALLTAARMDAAWLGRKLGAGAPASCREHVDRLLRTLDGGISLKRRIIGDLRPPLLQELGLVAALRALGEDFAASDGVAVELALPAADIDLPPESALALFRIAQEALTNIRRHARARKVMLRLVFTPEAVRLRVEDDGAGFDPAAVGGRRHGLAGMRHRVQMFSGVFRIDSAPGRGTRVSASLPLAAAARRPVRPALRMASA